jgi:hypothetical protein
MDNGMSDGDGEELSHYQAKDETSLIREDNVLSRKSP